MTILEANIDVAREVRREPKLLRAYWSRRRARLGDTVLLTIETQHIPNDVALRLELRALDADPSDAPFAVVEDAKVRAGRCLVEHTINWEVEPMMNELTAGGHSLVCFDVVAERYCLRGRSSSLHLSLEPDPSIARPEQMRPLGANE